MKLRTFLAFAMLTSAVPMLAAVQGVVMNGSTGARQAGVTINLVQPGASGMQQLGTVDSGENGTFQMEQTPQGVALVQAVYQGVTYTQPLPPGSPTTGLQVTVYEAVPVAPEMETQHLILLEPTLTDLSVAETYFIRNLSQFTFQDPQGGSLRRYLPEGVSAEGLQVTVDSTGVPVTRPLEAAGGGMYRVNYPVKPGETRFDLKYQMPPGDTYTLRVTTPPTRLVSPAAVFISGEGVRELGMEPTTQARVYEVTGETFSVKLAGIGALASNAVSSEDTGAPQCCEEVLPRIYTQILRTPIGDYAAGTWVLGLGILILALGGILLFRRGTATGQSPESTPAKADQGPR